MAIQLGGGRAGVLRGALGTRGNRGLLIGFAIRFALEGVGNIAGGLVALQLLVRGVAGGAEGPLAVIGIAQGLRPSSAFAAVSVVEESRYIAEEIEPSSPRAASASARALLATTWASIAVLTESSRLRWARWASAALMTTSVRAASAWEASPASEASICPIL
ncbi:hypothetical protein [Actinotignum sanguinis]|uniref:hypothetical protein n=1 Tax=Actinotignum sanguinis TaxID=1445614 RepID=UPI002934C1E0|nr:hypothetical protein [Actinotignum sanguinis]MDV2436732.1 hypothetical protein [Actinotignum sanguinis]